MKTKIAVFDACGTITQTNNTFDFINYVLKKDNVFRFVIFKLLLFFSLIISFTRINSLIKRDIIREWSIQLLKDFSVDLIEKRAKKYIEMVEKKYLNEEMLKMIDKEKKNKNKVIIISSSIDPPIKELAAILNIEYISSELEVKNRKYTGKLKKDLLGKKEKALKLFLYDLNNSSIYSDNFEDLNFMKNFGEIYPVVYGFNKKLWGICDKNLNILYLNNSKFKNKDSDSINEKTVGWSYIPVMYYIFSRFHLVGLFDLFLKEIIPFIFMVYLFANEGLKTFFIIPLSFIVFYSVYEIGGLYNDLIASKEKNSNNTLRIKNNIKINFILFIFIRIFFIIVILMFLFSVGYCKAIYVLSLSMCLIIYIIHSLIKNNLRIITFLLLKIFRNAVPLLIFINSVDNSILINIFLAFFLVDSPPRIYNYFLKRFNMNQLKINNFKIKLYFLEVLLSLIIWFYLSIPIYLIVSTYFLTLSIIGYLFKNKKSLSLI
jgi:phosphoserine phosphatase